MKSFNLNDYERIIISVIGPHAGKSVEDNFSEKISDIQNFGYCYWISKSWACNMSTVLNFCKEKEVLLVWILSSSNSYGKDTNTRQIANYWRENENCEWKEMNKKMNKTTGKLPSNSFLLDEISIVDSNIEIDLWKYIEYSDNPDRNGLPFKSIMGKSTICVVNIDKYPENNIKNLSKHEIEVANKKNKRKVVAIGRLKNPFYIQVTESIINQNDKFLKKKQKDEESFVKKQKK